MAGFFDTNILIYAALQPDPRSDAARDLLAQGGTISVQVLNEFVAVARRKLRRPWPEIIVALDSIRILCTPARPVTLAMHDAALLLAQRFGFGFYDALIVAAALEAGCETLFSEDLQDGQVIDGRLGIRNPFAAIPGPARALRNAPDVLGAPVRQGRVSGLGPDGA